MRASSNLIFKYMSEFGHSPSYNGAFRAPHALQFAQRTRGGNTSQVKLILSPKQRAKPAASRTRTCTNAAVCTASGECPSRFLHRAENESVSGHEKMPPASHQVSATSLKLLIQQIHPHVRVERDSGICVAHGLYELRGRSPYTRMFVARTSH